jgi:hypothetical protein
MPKHSSHVLDMARKGAEHKYEELKAEIARLVKNFPHLTGGQRAVTSQGMAAIRGVGKGVVAKLAPRKRRKMSAKARAAISAAQKARWAKQKGAVKK